MRQSESGRVAWKKSVCLGGGLFFREGCRRKEEVCGREGGRTEGWGQPAAARAGPWGDMKRDAVLRVP